MSDVSLFSSFSLPNNIVADIHRMNPWWQGQALPVLPSTKRHLIDQIKRRLSQRLAPIIVVRGPRQIGKTTAQLQLIEDFLRKDTPSSHIFRLQFDELPGILKLEESILRLVDWYEKVILKKSLNDAAQEKEAVYLFLDEVQNLDDWATQLKSLVDHSTVQVIVTGSSALRIERGRDSLAGRINTIEAGVLSLTEIAKFYEIDLGKPFLKDNGLEPLTKKDFWIELRNHGKQIYQERDTVFKKFSERGAYPLAHLRKDVPWEQIADQLNETVVKRVIQHDLRVGEKGRKRDASLLEEVFRLSCRYAGQSPSLQTFVRETQRALNANIGSQKIRHYMRFLGDTLLLKLIEPLEIRLKKKRGAPKICLADHGLRASWLQEQIPLDAESLEKNPHLTSLAGHLAESIVGSILSTIGGLDLAYFPERSEEPEVDFVLTIGEKRIPLEVKYQKTIDALRDTEGLRTFLEKSVNRAPFALLITQTDEERVDDPRMITLPLSSLMLLR
ncbi:MAG: ATP-binding protein [Verrucomicrobiota bacterium]